MTTAEQHGHHACSIFLTAIEDRVWQPYVEWRRKGVCMRSFKWIEWNLQKIDAHGLTADEVEAAFEHVIDLRERNDGSYQMFAVTPSGRRIWVIWTYNREGNGVPDIFGEMPGAPVFVITAY